MCSDKLQLHIWTFRCGFTYRCPNPHDLCLGQGHGGLRKNGTVVVVVEDKVQRLVGGELFRQLGVGHRHSQRRVDELNGVDVQRAKVRPGCCQA
jgi:hypothetical protein